MSTVSSDTEFSDEDKNEGHVFDPKWQDIIYLFELFLEERAAGDVWHPNTHSASYFAGPTSVTWWKSFPGSSQSHFTGLHVCMCPEVQDESSTNLLTEKTFHFLKKIHSLFFFNDLTSVKFTFLGVFFFSLFYSSLLLSLTECCLDVSTVQEPVKSRAPQLHLEYRFYKTLGTTGKVTDSFAAPHGVFVWRHDNDLTVLEDQLRRLHHFHNKWLLNSGYVLILV